MSEMVKKDGQWYQTSGNSDQAELDSLKQNLNNLMDFRNTDDEYVVGSFNGKPLYRKRVFNNQLVSNQSSVDVSSLHIEYIVNTFGSVRNINNGYIFTLGFYDNGASGASLYMRPDGKIYISLTISNSGTSGYTTAYIDYTKSTD